MKIYFTLFNVIFWLNKITIIDKLSDIYYNYSKKKLSVIEVN